MNLPIQVGFVWSDPDIGHDAVPTEADILKAITTTESPVVLVEPVDADFGVWLVDVPQIYRDRFETYGWFDIDLGEITLTAEAP
jgi:hypothetical protein